MENNFKMVAITFFGMEEILAKELLDLGAQEIIKGNRSVTFKGDKGFMYKVNLCIKTAIKILKPIFSKKVRDTNELYEVFNNFSWENYISIDKTFLVESNVFGKIFTHSKYVSLKAKDGIVDRFKKKFNGRPNISIKDPDLIINIHLNDNFCNVSINSSGSNLNQRGYRKSTNIAPINEVLASGIIKLTGWNGNSDFLDPMCGSGTFLIEAALIAGNIPGNLNRNSFAFSKWNDWDLNLFNLIKDYQLKKIKKININILGYDKSPSAILKAKENIELANLSLDIKVSKKDFFDSKKEGNNNLHIVTNPPYGERLKGDINSLYSKIGDSLKLSFSNTDFWFISSNFEAMKYFGLRPSRKIKLFNGKLESRLMFFPIYKGTKKIHKK
ncbi:MAG: RNA methyltransferase [Flavobacteriaceae bacterium]|nr:RNA methyltransferase [Flavobacteriaceae bacterium]